MYNRISTFYHRYWYWTRVNSTFSQFVLDVYRDFSFRILAFAELGADSANMLSDLEKNRNHFGMHPNAVKTLLEPINYLDDLIKVGIMNKAGALLLERGNALTERFVNRQEKLIADTLNNCTKTAWLLPKYLAHMNYILIINSQICMA